MGEGVGWMVQHEHMGAHTACEYHEPFASFWCSVRVFGVCVCVWRGVVEHCSFISGETSSYSLS